MNRYFTAEEEWAGELAVRSLSDKAQEVYNTTYPVWVAVTNDGEKKTYWLSFCESPFKSYNTIEELDEVLTSLWAPSNKYLKSELAKMDGDILENLKQLGCDVHNDDIWYGWNMAGSFSELLEELED